MRRHLRLLASCCAVLLGTSGFDLLWSNNRNVTRGNDLLAAGKAKEALEQYDLALRRLPDDPGVRFNRALALAELNQLDEAQKDLLRASESRDPGLKARAHFNLGNALARQEKWKEAVEEYTRALTVDPRYFDAKWNLELARRKLKEQEAKKKQEEEKKQQEEEKKKQEEEQKKQEEEKKKQEEQQAGQDGGAPEPKPEPQDQKKQEEEKKQQEQQKQQQAGQEKEQPKPEPGQEKEQPKPEPQAGEAEKQPPQGTPRTAVDSVLDALEKNEKNLPLERLRARSRRRPDKDW